MDLIKTFVISVLVFGFLEIGFSNPIETSKCNKAPDGYFLFQNSYYKYHSYAQTWYNASETCKKEGGDLVVVNSEDEASLLIRLMEEHPADSVCSEVGFYCWKNYILVGFRKYTVFQINLLQDELDSPLRESKWKTVDGKSLNESGYSRWAPGKPNEYSDGENCGTFYRYGGLNDFPCIYRQPFVCEIPVNKCFGNKDESRSTKPEQGVTKPSSETSYYGYHTQNNDYSMETNTLPEREVTESSPDFKSLTGTLKRKLAIMKSAERIMKHLDPDFTTSSVNFDDLEKEVELAKIRDENLKRLSELEFPTSVLNHEASASEEHTVKPFHAKWKAMWKDRQIW
ncbi:uncharacterized protein LOC123294576 [Chrysoperla carnea]|uniref:uncharacterized protein LOC123294576 n=1 Tax=Chrysoperla carnea TaxID=189513 RepID=UPI001D08E7FB|nr:uncharacterized protein LOC123294576 [Chrysoperla carnea]